MLFFSDNKHSTEKNFSHCYGCGLCTLVCPVWQQTRDVSCTPHAHARAMQAGGDINVDGLFACILCGACEPVCPENIPVIALLTELRVKFSNHSGSNFQQKNEKVSDTRTKSKIVLLADNELLNQEKLQNRVLKVLSSFSRRTIELANDNGNDITQALQAGIKISASRKKAFLDSVESATKLIISNGLLKRKLQLWLPDMDITSLGYALSSLPGLQDKIGAKDLYIIESQAYHADFNFMVEHYDGLRRFSGCELNLDLQRLAIPTGGVGADMNQASRQSTTGFDTEKQGAWILQGLNIERIIVESVEDGFVMKKISSKPVIHVAELAGNKQE